MDSARKTCRSLLRQRNGGRLLSYYCILWQNPLFKRCLVVLRCPMNGILFIWVVECLIR